VKKKYRPVKQLGAPPACFSIDYSLKIFEIIFIKRNHLIRPDLLGLVI